MIDYTTFYNKRAKQSAIRIISEYLNSVNIIVNNSVAFELLTSIIDSIQYKSIDSELILDTLSKSQIKAIDLIPEKFVYSIYSDVQNIFQYFLYLDIANTEVYKLTIEERDDASKILLDKIETLISIDLNQLKDIAPKIDAIIPSIDYDFDYLASFNSRLNDSKSRRDEIVLIPGMLVTSKYLDALNPSNKKKYDHIYIGSPMTRQQVYDMDGGFYDPSIDHFIKYDDKISDIIIDFSDPNNQFAKAYNKYLISQGLRPN
jgi:hypothetical protein